MIFLAGPGYHQFSEAVRERLRWRLPHRFLGYPTNFTAADEHGVKLMQEVEVGPVNHRVECCTLAGFFRQYIEFDISVEIETADWLSFGEQKLRSITAGEVFHDDLGLEAIRARFVYYPRDVWLYMLASGWQRIGQEEHLMWRAGHAGDEIGSTIIAGRLVRDDAALLPDGAAVCALSEVVRYCLPAAGCRA